VAGELARGSARRATRVVHGSDDHGPESLRRELGRTVARGYAVEDREYEPDTRGLAAPVFGETGEAVAALAVVAPTADMPADRYSEFGEALMGAAAGLSSELGYPAAEPQRDGGA
jgi:IclR family transcriptional regulator, acetate operon repressor